MSRQSLSVENEKLMLQTCMGISSSDSLFVMYTPARAAEALRFVEAAETLGVPVRFESIAETVQKSDPLPGPVLDGFSSASAILLLVSPFHNQIFGHHPVKDRAVARGARVGFVTIPIGVFDPKKIERIAQVSRAMGQISRKPRRPTSARTSERTSGSISPGERPSSSAVFSSHRETGGQCRTTPRPPSPLSRVLLRAY